ncbi:flagellar hook-basal body complex protein FliE [Pigmentiphaga litoralis]|jgi:flagellar hook-basal body complex protein FliE|uniref:flagellar hook-basal body complex protein FliE n=1 Tax=Pigmentiphaga litoralis TaxID=516702 RepID=UPI001677677C|nr:flagellar hook-basal body complex protein FliE [Pigmentiphaga litoralis]GGX36274.1 flagellar hook-basal body complex protein FliE [Pigmentiphaga litoralis]
MDRIQNVLSSTLAASEGASTGMARAAQMLGRPDALIGGGAAEGPAPSFSNILSSAIQSVASAQTDSKVLQTGYQMGDPEVGLEQTMIAMNKASLSFQMLTQARNKVVQAYTDVMNMPV